LAGFERGFKSKESFINTINVMEPRWKGPGISSLEHVYKSDGTLPIYGTTPVDGTEGCFGPST